MTIADPFSILVNAKRFAWAGKQISYVTICSMADKDTKTSPIVSYTGGPRNNPSGHLTRFSSPAFVADDMSFTVV